jgi:hypothetical protein
MTAKPSSRISIESDKRKLKQVCPICKVSYAPHEYAEHMRKEHADVQEDKHVPYLRRFGIVKSSAEIKSLLEYQKNDSHKYEVCPICKISIRSDEVEFHTRAAHPDCTPNKDGLRLGRNGLGPMHPVHPTVFVCPVCKVRLKSAAKLEKHSVIHSKRKLSKGKV